MINSFFDLLKGIVKSSATILDIGAGPGSLPANYYSVKSKLFVLDNNISDLKLNNLTENKIIGSINSLPFRDARFDLIILKYVLEHVENPDEIIKNISFYTNSNQFVYVVVPKYYAFQDSIYRFLGRCCELLKKGKQAHIQKYSFGTLCRKFYDNGFVLVDFHEAEAGLSFLDKTPYRKQLKKVALTFIKIIKKIFNKNLLERNEMHFMFCKFY